MTSFIECLCVLNSCTTFLAVVWLLPFGASSYPFQCTALLLNLCALMFLLEHVLELYRYICVHPCKYASVDAALVVCWFFGKTTL